ncbi:hypothetical protein I2I11_05750 [Pontibacter sp. 172403-2]|nr:hypothetical protein [Pontibacter sp. 172403-2]
MQKYLHKRHSNIEIQRARGIFICSIKIYLKNGMQYIFLTIAPAKSLKFRFAYAHHQQGNKINNSCASTGIV